MTTRKPGALDLRSGLLASATAAQSLVPASQLSPTSPDFRAVERNHGSHAPGQNAYESRKLLQHLLDSISTLLKDGGTRRRKQTKGQTSNSSDSEDDQATGQHKGWASQALMLSLQLRDLLILSRTRSWHLLPSGPARYMASFTLKRPD